MTPYRALVYTLLFIGLINSCSKIVTVIRIEPDYPNIHPHLKDTIQEVNKLSKGCLGNLKYAGFMDFKAKFGKDNIAGMANWILPFFEPQININPDYWYKLNSTQKKLLIAHELYHAEKPYIGHINDKDDWGCAEHLMYYQMQSNWCDIYKFEQYVSQMGDCHD